MAPAGARAKRRRGRLIVGAVVGCLVLGGLVVAVALLSASPAASPPAAVRPLVGSFELGKPETLATGTSDPGTSLTLAAPADGPLGGIEVSVPAGAYPEPVAFTLTSTPINGHSYGALINPASPLIGVDSGEHLAAVPITVRIPVVIPDGHVALAFFARPDGTLEAIPIVVEDATSITIATRHFSSFVVSTIASALLPADIGTGFRPGEDDFSTPNYGSVAFPDGHCAGQSLAEMWYFAERKQAAGEPNLWDRFDASRGGPKTPGFWQDDAAAYRLASEVHGDLDWEALSGQIARAMRTHPIDRLTYDVFRYAMLVTGAPQFVGISVDGRAGGHVLVAYAVTPSGLWVADPNDPGELRQVAYSAATGAFTPYRSGPIAGTGGTAYDQIGFYGRTALVDWAAIGRRFAEADGQPAGLGPDARFPTYDVVTEVPSADGTTNNLASVLGDVASPTTMLTIFPLAIGSTVNLRVSVYDGTRLLGSAESTGQLSITLAAGSNQLGLYLEAQTGQGWRATDFARSTVTIASTATPSTVAPNSTEPHGVDQSTDAPPWVTVKDPADWAFDCAHPPTSNPDPEPIEMQYLLAWARHCGGAP